MKMGGGYYQLSKGTCGDKMIVDKATCEAAAKALGLKDTTVTTSTYTFYAPVRPATEPGTVLRLAPLLRSDKGSRVSISRLLRAASSDGDICTCTRRVASLFVETSFAFAESSDQEYTDNAKLH